MCGERKLGVGGTDLCYAPCSRPESFAKLGLATGHMECVAGRSD